MKKKFLLILLIPFSTSYVSFGNELTAGRWLSMAENPKTGIFMKMWWEGYVEGTAVTATGLIDMIKDSNKVEELRQDRKYLGNLIRFFSATGYCEENIPWSGENYERFKGFLKNKKDLYGEQIHDVIRIFFKENSRIISNKPSLHLLVICFEKIDFQLHAQ